MGTGQCCVTLPVANAHADSYTDSHTDSYVYLGPTTSHYVLVHPAVLHLDSSVIQLHALVLLEL